MSKAFSVGLTAVGVVALGVACGAINGYLIGYLRLRAFLTTLVTLIIFRSIYDILFLRMSTAIVASFSPIRIFCSSSATARSSAFPSRSGWR